MCFEKEWSKKEYRKRMKRIKESTNQQTRLEFRLTLPVSKAWMSIPKFEFRVFLCRKKKKENQRRMTKYAKTEKPGG